MKKIYLVIGDDAVCYAQCSSKKKALKIIEEIKDDAMKNMELTSADEFDIYESKKVGTVRGN